MYRMFIPIVQKLQESAEAKLKQPVDIFIKIFRTYDEGIDALVKGDVPEDPGLPESFNVLVRELQSLCLDVELLKV